MPELTNLEISKVYEGKSGEGQYGPWTAYNFYFKGGEKKFSYFSGGSKPVPVVGMKVMYLKYEVVTKGEYTNNNVTEMRVGEPQQNTPSGNTEDTKAYINHGEVVVRLMELSKDYTELDELIDRFNHGIQRLTGESDPFPEPNNTHDDINEPPPITDDDIPY